MVDETRVTLLQQAISPVRRGAGACLVALTGNEIGRKFALKGEIKIGRTGVSDICVGHASVSRQHAVLIANEDGVTLRDTQSTNGSFVNDQRVEVAVLADGDVVRFGQALFKFLSEGNVETDYHDELYRLSTIDGLTQIYNKRYFQDTLEREFSNAQRYGRRLVLMMFDIDHFKRCNDTYGHLAGDAVLKQLAEVVRGRSRRGDTVARTGGEEFSILLPETDIETAAHHAEVIRLGVAATHFTFEGREIPVTISVGLAALEPENDDVERLVQRADARLYQAKQGGRNRVVHGDSV